MNCVLGQYALRKKLSIAGVSRLCLLLTIFAVTAGPIAFAQADTKAAGLLAAALNAFGANTVQDVTLAATVQRNPGAKNDPMQATFKALANGSVQVTYQTSSGAVTETRFLDANGTWAGKWTDDQGNIHELAYHNMMTEPAWFFPLLGIARGLRSTKPDLTVSYDGLGTFQGKAAQHLTIIGTSSSSPQVQAWARTDLYLDPLTLLPAGLTYNEHPDNNVLVDIPVTVTFSKYSVLNGILLPTHVQQFLNSALSLDVQIESANFNSGLTITLP